MATDEEQGWFYAKRYGFGTSFPRTWQGWLVTAIFIAGVMAAGFLLLPIHPALGSAAIVTLTAAFVVIAWKTTKGGWKWRWGKDDGTW